MNEKLRRIWELYSKGGYEEVYRGIRDHTAPGTRPNRLLRWRLLECISHTNCTEPTPEYDDTVIFVPSDAQTINQAIKYVIGNVSRNKRVVIDIEPSHKIERGVKINDRFLPHVWITSQSNELKTAKYFDDDFILSGSRSVMPTWDIFVNMSKWGRDGIRCTEGSFIHVTSGSGIKNAGGRGINVDEVSTAQLDNAVFVQSDSCNLHVHRGSIVNANEADLSGGYNRSVRISNHSLASLQRAKVYGGRIGIRISHASNVNAKQAEVKRTKKFGIRIDKSSQLDIPYSIITNHGEVGIKVEEASTVNASEAVVSNNNKRDIKQGGGICVEGVSSVTCRDGEVSKNGGHGVLIQNNSSFEGESIDICNNNLHGIFTQQLSSASLQNAKLMDNGGYDLFTIKGSHIGAWDCETTNGAGKLSLEDINIGNLNSIQRDGIIYY